MIQSSRLSGRARDGIESCAVRGLDRHWQAGFAVALARGAP